ncbi:MAG: CoA transferase [Filomicrobium sp.]
MKISGPLDNLLVIDLTRVLAGPYATMVMADLGARVIKVEAPGSGDDARQFGPFINGQSAYFMSLNRGKESIALNLKEDDDRAVFEDLVKRADVLVENYRPGTMQKLNYGWDKLQELNPRLIYSAISGFGHSGPYSKRAAYDMVVQGMGGIMSVTGYPDSGPTRVGTSIGDITAGLFGLNGILSALLERERTGKGAFVDVGMLDCQVAILENAIGRYLADGKVPQPLGARHPSITPFEAYRTSDSYIIVAAGNDTLFGKLCKALGRDELADDPEFQSNDLRTRNVDRLKREIEAALASNTSTEWLSIIGDAGVPCGPINNVEQVVNDEHVVARNMIISSDDPAAGSIKMAGNPIKMSSLADPSERAPAPALDGNREDILGFLARTE